MLKKIKSWKENKNRTPLWRALLLEHRLPFRYRYNKLLFPLYSLAGKGIIKGAMQKQRELSKLINLLKKRRLQTILEIGTARGGTLNFLL